MLLEPLDINIMLFLVTHQVTALYHNDSPGQPAVAPPTHPPHPLTDVFVFALFAVVGAAAGTASFLQHPQELFLVVAQVLIAIGRGQERVLLLQQVALVGREGGGV